MHADLAVVLLCLAVAIAMFAANRPRMDAVALLVMTVLPFTGVLPMTEALAGFTPSSERSERIEGRSSGPRDAEPSHAVVRPRPARREQPGPPSIRSLRSLLGACGDGVGRGGTCAEVPQQPTA